MPDPLIRLLTQLPSAAPDPARAERIKRGCRGRLARQASRASAARSRSPRGGAVQVWQPLIVALAVAYLSEVIVQALRVYGRF
jgi:hypothetical protein